MPIRTSPIRTAGLPRLHKERGERRDFLPDLVRCLDRAGATEIVIEEGYGSAMGIAPETYLSASPWARFGTLEECFDQDLVVALRCPDEAHIRRLRPGSVLATMLHLATRPERAELLDELLVHGVTLDAITDDTGTRLIQNLSAVGWNGVHAAFQELARLHPDLAHPSRRPLHVTCLGAGGVAGHAIRAATRYGDQSLRAEMVARNVPGVEVTVADFDLTWHEGYMLRRLESTDLLVDATQRIDTTQSVVPNRWVAALPSDAVILDLAADPYDYSVQPPRIKGIEGVPHGDLDGWVFEVGDPAWDALGDRVDTRERRTALSCYSWPGLQPLDSMRLYGEQLEPVLAFMLATPLDRWDEDGSSAIERAVARAETSRWQARREVAVP
jgi:alanine dehydrogenase